MDMAEQRTEGEPAFVPNVTEAVPPTKPGKCASPPAVIAIMLSGAVVHVVSGTDTCC
jgi:hypothetical protein